MDSPGPIGRFVWHDLMTTDVNAALTFYWELFPEWEFEIVNMVGFDYHRLSVNGHKMGGFVPLEGAEGIPSHWISYVAVEDCDAAVQRVKDAGGSCCVPTFHAPDVGWFAVCQDPQGALIKPYQIETPYELTNILTDGVFCWDELLTNDPEGAKKFYSKVFGWELEEMNMGATGMYTLFKKDGLDVGGAMKTPNDPGTHPYWLTYIAARNIDERTAKAISLGGTCHVEPRDIPSIGRFSVISDPSGGIFALYNSAAATVA